MSVVDLLNAEHDSVHVERGLANPPRLRRLTRPAPIQPQLPGRACVGFCSLCGGDVMGHRGGWWAVIPPPADQCSQCGAVRADADDVIPMRRR